jgi:hypothetical protein
MQNFQSVDIEKSELKLISFLCPILKIQYLHIPAVFKLFGFEHVSFYLLIHVSLPIRIRYDDERMPR